MVRFDRIVSFPTIESVFTNRCNCSFGRGVSNSTMSFTEDPPPVEVATGQFEH